MPGKYHRAPMMVRATVQVMNSGDILIICEKCGYETTVKLEWAKSPFWEIFTGQALLVVLGHIDKAHYNGSLSKETLLLRTEHGKGGSSLVRLH